MVIMSSRGCLFYHGLSVAPFICYYPGPLCSYWSRSFLEASRNNICDDLHHHLIQTPHVLEPTQDQIHDYGLHLIAQDLRRHGKSLQDFPFMPISQGNRIRKGTSTLMNKEYIICRQVQQPFVDRALPTLNPQQSMQSWTVSSTPMFPCFSFIVVVDVVSFLLLLFV